ncbi:LodA/GoxA family CTQ-dependent oxidase [Longimicrobium sp.]|uniref:LodA/GoxA family CTQ-dependent oxidase n=1 Tax=Longimicrobium sp. TaxID=2029185 RepID=UPI002E365F4E|nr:LodA/GoxA family CTQ-dependent oxidase [Longimicrobium sp.]HEX6042463.1 LodA/GoxA family CTQ-dependent oxidase [Longimicrobium sp.]
MNPIDDARIVRAAIHPTIGVARIGNSQDEYFIGPEVTDPLPEAPGFYKERDNTGALKRQAARFRIYGYDAQGNVVRELTAADADIRWTVHVANKKSAWYQFQVALDIPEASAAGTDPSERRNASVQGDQRQQLVIDPGPVSIDGVNQGGPAYACDTGKFFGTPVYLGELRTDEAGRLIFLGGRGEAASYDGRPAITFANNDGWHDDTSDGPVTAQVTLGGRELPVEGAWVVTAPPNYAPNVIGIRTLHDLLSDLFITNGWLPKPKTVSFTRDIHPILERFNGLQWVNQGFATQFGWEGPNNFLRPEMLARLSARANPADLTKDPNAELRRQVFNAFRAPTPTNASPLPWPWIYGDAMERVGTSPRQHASVSSTQYAALRQWALGQFEADWNPDRPIPRTLEEVPVAAQPAMLDQASMHYCLADAFHPGCEVTWPIRHTTMFRSPYRILQRAANQPEPDYGPVLTPEIALSAAGPLNAQAPGDLTRWMAVPWQTDTSSCRAGYDPTYDPYTPTFWPARVPNHVISEDRYERIVHARTPEQRQAEFRTRDSWFRGLTGTYQQYINQMIAEFGKMGVVEPLPVAEPLPGMPPVMMVETGYGFGQPAQPRRIAVPALVSAPEGVEFAAVAAEVTPSLTLTAETAAVESAPAGPVSAHVAAAGWDSDELFEQFASRVGTSAHDG